MKKITKTSVKLLIVILLYSFRVPATYSAGLFANSPYVQAIPTEFRALIVYDGKIETLYDSVTFNTNPVIAWNFSYIIAVPSKPEVAEIEADLFTPLEKLTEKKLSKGGFMEKLLYFDVTEENNTPPRIYTRPLDIIKIEVFGPENGNEDMSNYLKEFGYTVPKDGLRLIKEHQEKKWYFVVAELNVNHLQLEASESLTIPGANSFPIKIEFATDKMIYPLKLAVVQPDYDSETITHNYEYGSESKVVLGVEDEKIDDMLSYQSKNKYPQIPFQYTYPKTELFVLSPTKVEAEGFTVHYASPITQRPLDLKDYKGNSYLKLPDKNLYLTALYKFTPVLQLTDITLTESSNNKMVNSKPNLFIQIGKIVLIAAIPLVFLMIIWKYFKRN